MGEEMYNKIIEILPLLNIDYVKGIITTPKGGHGTIDSTGYLVFQRNRIKFQLHQVLAVYHFGKECIGMTVNHKNGNKEDNRIDNLELMTLSDNVKHQHRIGLAFDQRKSNKETSIKVLGTNIETGESLTFKSIGEASRATNSDRAHISKCIKGKQRQTNGYTWKSI